MKLLFQDDFILKAFQDFLSANKWRTVEVGSKGKLIIEVSQSQIKGWFVKEGNKEKLKQISYQIKTK